jgi:hypothetical protein
MPQCQSSGPIQIHWRIAQSVIALAQQKVPAADRIHTPAVVRCIHVIPFEPPAYCNPCLLQVVAHEVVQSAPGSSMAKLVLVDGVYPVLALGARRSAHAMQFPPSSTLEVLLPVQV